MINFIKQIKNIGNVKKNISSKIGSITAPDPGTVLAIYINLQR